MPRMRMKNFPDISPELSCFTGEAHTLYGNLMCLVNISGVSYRGEAFPVSGERMKIRLDISPEYLYCTNKVHSCMGPHMSPLISVGTHTGERLFRCPNGE